MFYWFFILQYMIYVTNMSSVNNMTYVNNKRYTNNMSYVNYICKLYELRIQLKLLKSTLIVLNTKL